MDEIKVFDFHRIFLGDYPLLFLLEIVFRTVFMYGYTILLLRFLGKRGMGQLSNLELAIIICFGSAVGDPMIGAQVPIVYGIVAITTVAFLQVGMEKFINSHKKIEQVMEGSPECLVNEGVILLDKLKQENLSQADLFRALRNKDVIQLGEVKKAYFETSGDITVLFQNQRNLKPGLCVMPQDETNKPKCFGNGSTIATTGKYSCCTCGYTAQFKAGEILNECNKCGNTEWVKATGQE